MATTAETSPRLWQSTTAQLPFSTMTLSSLALGNLCSLLGWSRMFRTPTSLPFFKAVERFSRRMQFPAFRTFKLRSRPHLPGTHQELNPSCWDSSRQTQDSGSEAEDLTKIRFRRFLRRWYNLRLIRLTQLSLFSLNH